MKFTIFLTLLSLLFSACRFDEKPTSSNASNQAAKSNIVPDSFNEYVNTAQDNRLFEAAKSGNFALVKDLINKGLSPDARGEGTANHDESGAIKNSELQWTALMAAAANNHLDVVKLLLENGANITAHNTIGYTALHYACQNNYTEIAKFLLKNNAANYDTTLILSGIPLYWAESYENENLANELIDLGENVDYWNEETDRTNLINAFYNKLPNVGIKLIKKGADVNAKGKRNGETALMWASAFNYLEPVKLLLAKNADVNAISESYYTALAFASRNDSDDVSIPLLLLAKGAIINPADRKGRSALIEAAGCGNLKIAKLLLNNGALPNQRAEFFGYISPLREAVFNNDFEMTKLLVENGANVNILTDNGSSILLEAVWNEKNINIVTYLIEHGADVNKANDDGETPILKCISYNEPKLIRLLMQHGADIHVKDGYGRNAISLAEERKDKELLKLVKSYY